MTLVLSEWKYIQWLRPCDLGWLSHCSLTHRGVRTESQTEYIGGWDRISKTSLNPPRGLVAPCRLFLLFLSGSSGMLPDCWWPFYVRLILQLICDLDVEHFHCLWRTKAEIMTAFQRWICLIFKSIVWRDIIGHSIDGITHDSTADMNWASFASSNNWHAAQ
jgi:hypothetical protein